MDIKKFGRVVLFLGLIIAAYGAVHITLNRPVSPKQVSTGSWEDGFRNLGNAIDAASENEDRKAKRQAGIVIVAVGGIVGILGGGLMASAKGAR